MSAGKWIHLTPQVFQWASPSGRIYRVEVATGGIVNALCDGDLLKTQSGKPRLAWWRSPSAAMFECECREGRRAMEESRLVQTSAPVAPAPADKSRDLTPLGHALFSSRVSGLIQMGNTEQVEFRVDQALGALKRGVVDEVIAWLEEATTAARVMKKVQRDAAIAEAGSKP